jgi:GNAT superfamily N-acetyltransferase
VTSLTNDAGAAAFLRPIRRADIPACVEVFDRAVADLHAQQNREPPPYDPGSLERLLEHLLRHDPDLAWLAEPPSSTTDPAPPPILGFAAALQRDAAWHLSLLYVRPDSQGEGLGRRLMLACLPRGPVPGDPAHGAQPRERGTLSVFVDAGQPVSTGLYAGYGLVPRVPVYTVLGHPDRESLGDVPEGIVAVPFEAVPSGLGLDGAVDAVDRATLGNTRAVDHAMWLGEGHRGVLFVRDGSGEPLGYGYTSPAGRLGPVAVLDPVLTPGVLGALLDRERPAGPWVALVPGPHDGALVALLRAGLRFEGAPGVFAATRPTVALDRYLPFSFALP